MKKIIICMLASVFSAATTSVAEDKVSFGVGAGALYNGLGVNVSFMKESDLKYVSLGCTGFGYSSSNEVSSICGIGAGWMRSDILSENDKHGLGVHMGVTYNDNTRNDRNDTEVFIGIPYLYFFKGMTAGGWNVGLTPTIEKRNGKVKGDFLLNLGYQF